MGKNVKMGKNRSGEAEMRATARGAEKVEKWTGEQEKEG
jgi:hypothetical protein